MSQTAEQFKPITNKNPTDSVPHWIPFRLNEKFPLKGFWFQIIEIHEDHLVISPVSRTGKADKTISGRFKA